MGSELTCSATMNGQRSEGKALLETTYLQFRGEFRFKILFQEMKSVKAKDGRLEIRYPEGQITLDLGSAAQRWEKKILNPPTLADKLGIKGGETVSVLGVSDSGFVRLLEQRAGKLSNGRAVKESDLIFLGAEEKKTLQKLEKLKTYLKPDGAIWVIRPKGRKEITEMDVINDGKSAGLVDTKVAAFSPTHTAEKLVIPVKDRR